MANYTKKNKTSFWQNEHWQTHKSTCFDYVFPFAIKKRYLFKTSYRKIGTIFEIYDFKNRGCLTFLDAARQPYVTSVWFCFFMQGK